MGLKSSGPSSFLAAPSRTAVAQRKNFGNTVVFHSASNVGVRRIVTVSFPHPTHRSGARLLLRNHRDFSACVQVSSNITCSPGLINDIAAAAITTKARPMAIRFDFEFLAICSFQARFWQTAPCGSPALTFLVPEAASRSAPGVAPM